MFGWTLALLCFYFFLNGKGVLPFPVVYLQCRVQLPSNRTVPMFEDGDSRVSQQLASQWHWLLFSYFFKIKFGHQVSTYIPSSLISFFTQAQHPHTSLPLQLKRWAWVWSVHSETTTAWVSSPSPPAWPSRGSTRECFCLPAAFIHVGYSLFWPSHQSNLTFFSFNLLSL